MYVGKSLLVMKSAFFLLLHKKSVCDETLTKDAKYKTEGYSRTQYSRKYTKDFIIRHSPVYVLDTFAFQKLVLMLSRIYTTTKHRNHSRRICNLTVAQSTFACPSDGQPQ